MRKRKYLNTLVALIVLAALWEATTLWERRKGREAPKVESTQEKLLAVDSAHIQSLALKPRSGEAISCRREGSSWVIVEPRKLATDPTTISSLLSNLTDANVDQVVDAHASSLKDFGLAPPAFTIEASTDRQPARFTLLLGDETPTSGGIYAQVVGNPRVVTLPSYLKSSLEKNLFDLRDKRVVTLDTNQIQKIEAESKGKRWTLVKNPEGVWDLVVPPPARADRYNVENIVDRLKSVTMQTLASEDRKKGGDYGFGAASLRVVLTSHVGTQTIVLGKKDKEGDRYYAMNSALEPVFTVASDFLTQFQKDRTDLLEKDLFTFSVPEVKYLELETPAGRRVFELQKDKWKRTTPAAKDENSDKVHNLLNRIRDLRAVSFPKDHPENLAAFGLIKPSYKFQVRFGDKNQSETVEASKVGDRVYARRSTDPIASGLVKTALDDVDKALKELQ